METAPADKMIKKGDTETKVVEPVATTEYFYPDHGVTIVASSQEEADTLLANKLGGAKL